MPSTIAHRNVYEVSLGVDLVQKLFRDPSGISLQTKDALVVIRFDEEVRAHHNEKPAAAKQEATQG